MLYTFIIYNFPKAKTKSQSQSLNLWVEEPNYKILTSMHFYSWEQGLKSGIYYLRRKPRHQPQQFTIQPKNQRTTKEKAGREKERSFFLNTCKESHNHGGARGARQCGSHATLSGFCEFARIGETTSMASWDCSCAGGVLMTEATLDRHFKNVCELDVIC